MTEASPPPPRRWRDGLHPNAMGFQILSMGRVQLPLGDALRVEMLDPTRDREDLVHVQYYICSGAGGWALWVSCPRNELAEREATLQAIPPLSED